MWNTTLPLLRCPSFLAEEETCAGSLNLSEVKQKKSGDILFGTLTCEECASTYPILAGIALLVNDVEEYLQNHAKGIAALVNDPDIPAPYRESFSLAKAALESGLTEDDLESLRVNAMYFMSHYLKAKGKKPWWRPKKGAFSVEINRLLKNYWDHGPLAKVSEWTKGRKNQSVVELGCGVGGVAKAIGPSLGSYLGVDSAFTSVALARHLHAGAPYATTLRIPGDLYLGPANEKITLPKPARHERVDFVVGELENLPVALGQFDLAIALSTIDMIEDPRRLPKLQYGLLKEGGLAIQSSPYIWHEVVAENLRKTLPKSIQSSSAAVESLYAEVGFHIVKKIDHLPWLVLKHFREIALYSVHCFLAQK